MSEPDLDDDLAAIVRFHGANQVLDATIAVAREMYGEDGPVKVHELLLRRLVRDVADRSEATR